ncbi:MAG: pirin family protein [SAR324 cluster bacterium]|nr:pirin family protein [SAR324 cluster bacterium]
MKANRAVLQVVMAQQTSDGAGVNLKRSIGKHSLSELDPFLLLDEFRSDDPNDYIAGFPSHPHRGFETVTYMLAGSMQHQDSNGNTGNLTAGSVQWMTAGRGIIHSEMPQQEDGLMWGFQLWVNLPAKDKMCVPRYQDIPPADVQEYVLENNGLIRVIAGQSNGLEGPVKDVVTRPLYLDVRLPEQAQWTHPIPSHHTAFVYVFEGEGYFGKTETDPGRKISSSHLGILGRGDTLMVETGDHPVRFLLLAAQPLNEPIARYGPFVMNTRSEIEQAFQDYQNGRF